MKGLLGSALGLAVLLLAILDVCAGVSVLGIDFGSTNVKVAVIKGGMRVSSAPAMPALLVLTRFSSAGSGAQQGGQAQGGGAGGSQSARRARLQCARVQSGTVAS